MRFGFVTPEISPFTGGGIAPMVRATVQLLAAAGHEVDVFTRAAFRDRAAALFDDRLPVFSHPRIRWHWAPEPRNDSANWHAELAESFARSVAGVYARRRPDLIELQDYLGSGAAIATGRGGGVLDGVPVAVRLNSSAEQVLALDGGRAEQHDRAVHELERASLRAADVLLGPSDAVGNYYRRFYDDEQLPEFRALWPGFLRDDAPQPQPARVTTGPLELLYLGRLQELKGVAGLVEALLARPDLPLRLTLVGKDTDTAPGGGSMLAHLERLVTDAGDGRITFAPAVPREAIGTLIGAHDAVIVPSRWEAWGNVALEVLAARRALLVTPVANLPQMAGDGRFGLVGDGLDADALGRLLERAVGDLPRLRALAGSPALSAYLDELTDEQRVVAGYEQLA